MEKKIECKIVQDLLLGYVDNVLNEESKKVVEKHLSECDMCQKRLKDIKKDINSCNINSIVCRSDFNIPRIYHV